MQNIRVFIRFAIFILIISICRTSEAQLQWEKRHLDFQLKPSDTRVVAVFPFVNAGKKTIKFKEVKPSCGCVTATQEKTEYAPGESGKITAIFDLNGRTGIQDRSIYIKTSDPKEPELLLSFKAVIPEILELDPIFLNWPHGETLAPKVVNVKVMNHFPVKNLAVTSTSPNIMTEVKHPENSDDLQIVVTPKPGNGEINAGLEIKPDFPDNSPKYFHVYIHVDR